MIGERIRQLPICLCMWLTLAYSDVPSVAAEQNVPSLPKGKTVVFRVNSMCGPNCLWQVARACGKAHSLREIATLAGTASLGGTTVEGMIRACHAIALPAEALRADGLETVAADPRVPVLLLKADGLAHYAILDSFSDHRVRLLDGADFRELSASELANVWTGVAILIGDPPKKGTVKHIAAMPQLIRLVIVSGSAACFVVSRLAGLARRP